jgi:hypothetical protein
MDAEQSFQAVVHKTQASEPNKRTGQVCATVPRQDSQLYWDGNTYRETPEKTKVDADQVW